MHKMVLTVILTFIFLPVLQVLAVAPAAPPTFTATTTNFASTTVPIAIPSGPATITDTITVSGLDTYILDVDLTTFIPHTFAGDLDITLTSPSGTTITITTDNGGSNDNVFNGTLWDDSASIAVVNTSFSNLVVQPYLIPEGALGGFVGENPNGVWTLEVTDDTAFDVGSLDNWSLDITTLDAAPTGITTSTSSTTVPIAIPSGPATITDTITVSGIGDYILDINMRTFIPHTYADDLDITLTSPSGTTITITTDNGEGYENVFNGTLWDDSATVPVTDAAYSDNVVQTRLVPEGALGAFIGEDPNGVWTLTITDDAGSDGGSLDNWSLDITTTPFPIYASNPAPGAIAMNTTVGTAANRDITISEAGSADLTISAISLVGDAEISLSANPAPFTIVDGSGASQVVTVTCNSATTGTFTATLTVTDNTSTSPETYNIRCRVSTVSPTAAPAGSDAGQPQIAVFDPAISKLGLLVPGQTGAQGEKLEWVVTVSNVGTAAGNNVTVTDTLSPSLRIDSVDAPDAGVTIGGQTVTVTYATLNVGQTVQFSIFTTSLNGQVVDNTACVTASNQGAEACATALPVGQLPNTGQTPVWRFGLLAFLGLGLIGFVVVLSRTRLVKR